MNPFATAAMAEGYARNRPALHERIVARAVAALGLESFGDLAVDVGCGSGLSTRALMGRARRVVGIEPVFEMTTCARAVAPGAHFVQGRGEAMPFGAGTVDVITAAGSLNYARPEEVLRETGRVLAEAGLLLVYDFAQGRTFADSGALGEWYAEFLARYPKPLSEAIPLDAGKVETMAAGLARVGAEEFRIALPYEWAAYAGYMMTETNVAAAMRRGEAESAICEWMAGTLPEVFGGAARDVVFPGYWVALRPQQ